MRFKAFATLLALLITGLLTAQEICNNGIDDDGDGLIDLNDPDCPCNTVAASPDLASYINNHSFEERNCCPLGFVSPFSPPWLSCATGWVQATASTTDYFHSCGYQPQGMPLPPPDGQGAVGFFVMSGYKEFVGTCLTWPLPANPLLAGTTYTLSMWIAGAATNNIHAQTAEFGQLFSSLWHDDVPLAIYGLANECVVLPLPGYDCMEQAPDWQEIGRTNVRPTWEWQRISITFTPTVEIHSIIIGAACDIAPTFTTRMHVNDEGHQENLMPYVLVDELLLTIAGDQVLLPVQANGNPCLGNVTATAYPPAGAQDYQWYLDGVALPGETGTTLDVSGGGYGHGVFTMASTYNGECLMGSTSVSPPTAPTPFMAVEPDTGCAPLSVAFADTTGGTTVLFWDLGDGTVTTESSPTHVYHTPGSYDVTLRVRDLSGCEGEVTVVNAVTVHAPVSGHVSVTPSPVHADDPSVTLAGSGSSGIVSWWWDLGAGEPSEAHTLDVDALFPAVPGDYPVILVVSSEEGCTDTVQAFVRVIDPGEVEMPNVFSPNADGHNDRFIPLDYKGTPALLEIYNRWGQVIFSTRNLVRGWDGHGAPDGTYFFIVIPDDADIPKQSGYVTLIR